MLASIENYNKDCLKLMGTILPHDDSLNDRSDGGILQTNFRATRELWQSTYGEDHFICGGMYRGEPPTEFWIRGLSLDVAATTRLAATAPCASALPTKWADVRGWASDGSPAFIPTTGQTKHEIKDEVRKEMYILGRYNDVTGFYHFETHEAQVIMVDRLTHLMHVAEKNLALAKGCCGNKAIVAASKKKLDDITEMRDIWKEASKPIGAMTTRDFHSIKLNRADGSWVYPTALFALAGGACGGVAATSGTCVCRCFAFFCDFGVHRPLPQTVLLLAFRRRWGRRWLRS
jgi:hypothetical protein